VHLKAALFARCGLLFTLGLLLSAPAAQAQVLSLNAFSTGNPIPVDDNVVYDITVSNLSTLSAFDVYISNSYPASLLRVYPFSVTNYYVFSPTTVTNSTSTVLYYGQIVGFTGARFTLTLRATEAGMITNFVTVFTPVASFTNLLYTNLVNTVTNAPVVADVAVAILSVPRNVIAGDYIGFGLAVTNAGSNSASGLTLSNNVTDVYAVQPAGTSATITSSNVLLSVGSLAANEVRQFTLLAHPTNTGPLTLTTTAVFDNTNVVNSNPSNDTDTASIDVTNYLFAVDAFITSTQHLNRQVTLLEQSITVSNPGPADAPSVRLLVSGLTNNLYNAWATNATGTNDPMPFLSHGAPLASGDAVTLLLQFAPNRSSFPFADTQLQAYAVPLLDLSAPTNGAPVSLWPTNIALNTTKVLVQFQSLTNRTYTLTYSDDGSTWLLAEPPVQSKATWVQWIDYGPPETLSPPPTNGMRLYRAFLNP
jgi:hypothetical protein